MTQQQKPAHTPGPFEAIILDNCNEHEIIAIHDGEGRTIAKAVNPFDVAAPDYETFQEELIANALLFAAAPETAVERDNLKAEKAELLAALRQTINTIECGVEAGLIKSVDGNKPHFPHLADWKALADQD